VDDVPVDYSSVAFWYGQPTYSIEVTDSLNTTDVASRQSHQYTVSGDTLSSLSSGLRIVPLVGLTSTTNIPFWTASNYQVLSQVPAFTTAQAPGPIANLAATGGQINSVTLSWEPDSAKAGVAGYQVYGSSTDPTVPVTPANLVGQTPVPGFQHTGLGLEQQWYYRVRALATNGQVGPISGVVTARTGNELKIEGESLVATATGTAPVVVQGNCCGVIWSGNAQLWFQASKVGDYMVLTINVPTAGTHDLSAVMTKARDYGIVSLAVDGSQLGQSFDGYNFPNVTVDYGSVPLSAGAHQLTFTLVGKNASSINYFVGIDYLLLTKTN